MAAIFFAFVVEICQEVGEWFVCCKVFCSWHSTWENEDIGIGEAGFCKCCVGEHGDAVGCLDLGGFFDGYGFDVDSGAAEKVYYGEAFDIFESVGQEDVCFFAHFLRYLLGDFYWIVL